MTITEHKAQGFQDLEGLFRARSVAVVGASANPKKLSGMTMAFLADASFDGWCAPVNPGRETIMGQPCYPSVAELPETPDVAVIATPTSAVEEALAQCSDRGVGYVVIQSGGFGEGETGEEGRARAERLRAIAARTGMVLVGPNTVGFVNFYRNMPLTFADWYGRDTGARDGVAVITHSGSVGGLMFGVLQSAGYGIHSWVGLGNELTVDAADFLMHYARDPDVRVVCMFLEHVRDGERFQEALGAAHDSGTQVVVLKSGRSAPAQRATTSHTGNLTGPAQYYAAILEKYGAVQVDAVRDFPGSVGLALAAFEPAHDRAVSMGILSSSGGACGLIADHAVAAGLDVPQLPAETQARLREAIPNYGSHDNPVDLSADATARFEIFEQAVDALQDDRSVGTWLVFGRALLDRYASYVGTTMPRTLSANVVACPGVPMAADLQQALRRDGVAVIDDPEDCAHALAAAAHAARGAAARDHRVIPTREVGPPLHPRRAEELLAERVPMPRSVFVGPDDDPVAQARSADLRYPLVAKLASAAIQHKTDVDGVVLGIADEADLRNTVEVLRGSLDHLGAMDGEVQLQETGDEGLEFLVSVTQDSELGAMVTIASGGVLTEVVADAIVVAPPIDRELIARLIPRLRTSALLDGHRGTARLDREAFLDVIVQAWRTVDEVPEITEVEFNPVRVTQTGALALDCLMHGSLRTAEDA